MHVLKTRITANIFLDNLFINLPLWFPLTFIFLVLNFPSLDKLIFIFTLFLFAETHFASTWLFFFDRDNWSWIKKNSYKLIFLPIYFLIVSVIFWFFSPQFVVIIHYLASGWHVTKQSNGLLKVYGVNPKIYQFIIYISSFSCLAIGLNEPGILSKYLIIDNFNLFLLGFLGIYFFILFLNKIRKIPINISYIFPCITGVLIYIPILFFKNLGIATAVGVGMHWCQYLAIIWSIYTRKDLKLKKNNAKYRISIFKKLCFVFSYALLMTSFSFLGMPAIVNDSSQYSLIYLIPLLFQFYHFYIDGYIWKFSDPHIKKSISPHIFRSS